MQKNIIIAVVVSAVVFGGAGYMLSQKSVGSTTDGASVGGTNRGNFAGGTGRGARAGGGMVGGEIIAKDANSITVKLRGSQTDGSAGSKIIFLSDTTQVTKSAEGSTTDLSIGTQVTAFGTQNSDGSVSAQSVQIRPDLPVGMERPTTTSQGN